ncbi:nuclease [Perilla frutescens var. hirtella]|uniref:Nuclease n=1 Tax=Perilla frutescens var. hirtella TaxID=608512 RepID=A0AAD4J4Y7_PERFH|nr:nuclease [Perilla frutescens var. hirtella]
MMVKPSTGIPAKIQESTRFMPFFKDCIGAIDGTHIPAMVPGREVSSFRNRHGMQSQNILAACNFDLQFMYVLSRWEGSAHDSKFLNDALSRRNDLHVPQGKYFLVDYGFANRRQFLAPLRGVRYHLKNFGGQGRHSRNATEYEGDQDLSPLDTEEENLEWLSQSQLQQRTEANAWKMSIANAMWDMRPMYNGDGNEDDETEDGNVK